MAFSELSGALEPKNQRCMPENFMFMPICHLTDSA